MCIKPVDIRVDGDAVEESFTRHGRLFKLEPSADCRKVQSEANASAPAPELDPLSGC